MNEKIQSNVKYINIRPFYIIKVEKGKYVLP